MKKNLLFFCLCAAVYCSGQSSRAVYINDMTGRSVSTEITEIKGTPLLNEDWAKGEVKFANGTFAKDIPIRYNIFSGELHFQRDEVAYTFSEPVSQFSFSYKDRGKDHAMLFRNGYPGPKSAMFYEVLAEGPRFQLLKRFIKTVVETQNYASAPSKSFKDATEIYVYDSKLWTINVIKNKQLAESTPEIAPLLATVPGNEKGKFKSEQELVDLFTKIHPK